MKSTTQKLILSAGLVVTCAAFTAAAQSAQPSKSSKKNAQQNAQKEQPQRSLVQREAQPVGEVDPANAPPPGAAIFPFQFRTIDGIFNNPLNPLWGAAGTNLARSIPADYADGLSTPSGIGRPSVRHISNALSAQDGLNMPNAYGFSDFIWQWGQFLDHDIDETPIASPAEDFDINVPTGDAWFDPMWNGGVTIGLDRSAYTMVQGVRQQINNITSYIDASNIYGSESERAHELRTNDGSGKLKTSPGDLLPFNTNGLDNAPSGSDPTMFLGGDVRANEQIGLTAMHTLFMREHNRLADQIAADLPFLPGELIYQYAKAMVTAEMQAITYNEFLPKLLGPNAIPAYTSYNPDADASITNLFATAAYRVGHTMLSSEMQRLDSSMNEAPEGHIALASAFFNPSEISANGIDSVLRGLAGQEAQNVDNFVIDDVRNFLFGAPGAGGFDLTSLNMQRGRDHGIPSYNAVRAGFGLPQVTDFSGVNPDPDMIARLEVAYDNVDQIDAWIGLLSEPHHPDAFVGETLYRILREQFINLRDGDRFWYEAYLPQDLIEQAESMTLAAVIRANTGIGAELQDDVFAVVGNNCPADFAVPFGVLDFFDVSAFVGFLNTNDPAGDFNNDGTINFFDVSAFLQSYNQGCP